MNRSSSATRLCTLHTACTCEIGIDPQVAVLAKDGCTVSVESVAAAFDCDACDAFAHGEVKPDIIALRNCGGRDDWLVIEMKRTLREHAGEQAKSGLSKLGQHARYPLQLDAADIIFVVKRRRKSDTTIMRAIGIIRVGGWAIEPTLLDSGTILRCPEQDVTNAEAAAA